MIQTLTILHILAMFIAFGFTTGLGILLSAVASSGDVRAIRTATRIAVPFQLAGGAVLLVGVIFGIATTASAGYGLGSKWVVIAYVLALLLIAVGIGVHQPWTRRLAAAAAAAPDGQSSSEVTAIANDRTNRIAGPISGLLWIAVIADMVLKPS